MLKVSGTPSLGKQSEAFPQANALAVTYKTPKVWKHDF